MALRRSHEANVEDRLGDALELLRGVSRSPGDISRSANAFVTAPVPSAGVHRGHGLLPGSDPGADDPGLQRTLVLSV